MFLGKKRSINKNVIVIKAMSLSLFPNVSNKNLFVSDTVPAYAVSGDMWFNTSNGVMLTFIRDEKGNGFWVETGSSFKTG